MYRQPPNLANNRSASLSGTQTPVVTSSTASTSPDNGETSMKMDARDVYIGATGGYPDIVNVDLMRCLRDVGTMSLGRQDRVRFLIGQPKFQTWLSTPTSMALLVNGNGDRTATFSPVTYLSAKLLQDLAIVKPVLNLHFLCSLHTSTAGNITDDPASMLKGFIHQLLKRKFAWDLTFLNEERMQIVEDGTDAAVLCGFFESMLLQLPSKTKVFCVVDEISFYERSGRRDDFVYIIRRILKMMNERENRVMKVLLTCHGRSQAVKECVSEDEILDETPVLPADPQGLSQFAWEQKVGLCIDKLMGLREQ